MLTALRHIVEGVTLAPSLQEAMHTLAAQTREVMEVDCCRITSYNVCYTKLLRAQSKSYPT